MSEDILVVGTMKETETKPENIIILWGEREGERGDNFYVPQNYSCYSFTRVCV